MVARDVNRGYRQAPLWLPAQPENGHVARATTEVEDNQILGGVTLRKKIVAILRAFDQIIQECGNRLIQQLTIGQGNSGALRGRNGVVPLRRLEAGWNGDHGYGRPDVASRTMPPGEETSGSRRPRRGQT